MEEWIKKMPKAELHCHLDGSLPLELLRRLALKEGIFDGKEEELKRLAAAPEDCESLEEYLKCFELPVACMQSREVLELAAESLLEEAAREGVIYLEARFAPTLHTRRGLSLGEVTESVLRGLERGKERYGVEYGLILCVMRHEAQEKGFQVLETAEQFRGRGVAALDLAGAEAAFPAERFAAVFREAKKRKLPFTIHAGEAAGPQSVRTALALGAARIGHGLAAARDRELLEELSRKGIVLELCPSSNLQTKAAESWEAYPLRLFMREGIPVTVNTDNRTVTGTTMTRELSLAEQKLGLTREELRGLCRQAVLGSFAPEEVKGRLLKKMEQAL